MNPRRRTRRKTMLAVTAVMTVAAILVVAAVVHSHDASTDDAATSQGQPGDTSLARRGHDLADCLRRHGYPQITDPVVTGNGDLDFGTQGAQIKSAMRALGTACHAQATALKGPDKRPPTPAELHQLVLFAQCMREHGVTDWPDPRPDGRYPLNQRLQRLGKRGFSSQLVACRQFSPDKRISVSSSSGAKNG